MSRLRTRGQFLLSGPARPRAAPDWTVRLRTRTYVGLLGKDMEAMIHGQVEAEEEPWQRQEPRRSRNPPGGLGRILGQ